MKQRQQNQWNWAVTADMYCDGFGSFLCSFETQQVWDGSKYGHERLMALLIEHLEDQADRMDVQFRVWCPAAVRGKRWAAGLPESVDIDRIVA